MSQPQVHVYRHEDSYITTRTTERTLSGMSDEIPLPTPGEPRKLVLCFDGTGNAFSGSNADTNVVKLLNKLDRNHPNQFHYYQSEFFSPLSSTVALLTTLKSWYRHIRHQRHLGRPVFPPVVQVVARSDPRPRVWVGFRRPRSGWIPLPDALL